MSCWSCACLSGGMKIDVEIPDGNTITLEVKGSDTINMLKAKLEKLGEGIPQEEQKLFFKNQLLEEGRKNLEYYNIKRKSTLKLELVLHSVVVKKPDGNTITLEEFKYSHTINDLKARVQSKEGIPQGEQNLFLEEQAKQVELEGGRTLKYYKIQRTSTVKLELLSHPVVVNQSNGKTINLEVKYSDTIEDLKVQVQRKEGFLPGDQMLYLPGKRKELDNKKTLASYKYSTVDLELRSGLVSVKKWNGERITLKGVKSSDTIYMLKAMVQDREGFPPEKQRLLLSGEELDDKSNLASYKIKKEATIDLELRSPLVYVKKPNGKIITFEVKSTNSDTILKLKEKVQREEGFLPADQMIFFEEKKELEDTRTLADCHIKNDSTVNLELRSHRVSVKKPDGKIIELEVKSSDTIYMLKAKVLDKVEIHPDKQRLLFKKEELEGGRTLASYNIPSDQSTPVDLTLKPN